MQILLSFNIVYIFRQINAFKGLMMIKISRDTNQYC